MEQTIYIYDDKIGRVELVDYMGDDKRIVNAARVSFGNDSNDPLNDKDVKLIKYLYKHRHTSPFEHCSITWKFVVPMFVRSQHHRHRTWCYNELSRRYTSENLNFFLPNSFRSQHKSNRQASNNDECDPIIDSESASELLRKTCFNCLEVYEKMLDAGISREEARMVLPQNLYTEYYGTVNLHNALHFLALRMHPHAQKEIRVVAEAMYSHLSKIFPSAIEAFENSRELQKKFAEFEKEQVNV